MASETVIFEPGSSAYHYVSHYSIDIEAPASAVWAQLILLESWMYEFDLTLESGEAAKEGAVRRLYTGQDFFIQTTKVVPNSLLVFANLPSRVNGEHSTGVATISLWDADETTTVHLTMSRRYRWEGTEPNPNLTMRRSSAFQERARAMWQDRFLGRLKKLVEAG